MECGIGFVKAYVEFKGRAAPDVPDEVGLLTHDAHWAT
jgi:hypothetical protein